MQTPHSPINSQALINYQERLHAALISANICVFEIDLTHKDFVFLENAQAIFGRPDEQLLSYLHTFASQITGGYTETLTDRFVHPEDAPFLSAAQQSMSAGQHSSHHVRMRAGESFIWCKLDLTPILEDGSLVRIIGVISDISDIKEEADQLQKAVGTEAFTGLFTRAHSEELIRKTLARDPHACHALMLLDLDHFKSINDSHGHMAGDKVLKSMAEHLKKAFRRSDIIGRFGGDEFLILLKDLPSRDILLSKIDTLMSIRDEHFGVTKSIGVALFPEDGSTFDQLLQKADEALYRAKETRNAWVI
ncbi:MAG: GGDEF domain-containing protein [Christensenellaceae bacterium]|nr:GGDEF domain-containing protein [Christensenellaceae bacterium]